MVPRRYIFQQYVVSIVVLSATLRNHPPYERRLGFKEPYGL